MNYTRTKILSRPILTPNLKNKNQKFNKSTTNHNTFIIRLSEQVKQQHK